jgi:hypothetical protein
MTTYTCPAGHQSGDADYCDTCGAPIAGGQAASASGAAAGGTDPGAGPAPSSLDLGAPAAPAGRTCPNCSAENTPVALFCEDCGYDFTTGAMPPPPLTPPDGPGTGSVPVLAPAGATPAGGTPALGLPVTGSVPATPSAPSAPSSPSAPPAPVAPPIGDPGAVSAEWVAELWIDPDWYQAQGADEPCPSPGPPTVIPLFERSLLIGRQSSSRNIHPQIDCGTDSGVSRRHAQLTTDGQRWWVEDLQSANGTFVGTAGGSLPASSIAPGLRREVAEDERLYLGAWTRIVIRRALPGE